MKFSIKKDYFYNSLYTIFNILFPLFTAPYLSRILGVNGVGVYAYTFSIAQYFVLIAKLGLVNYGTREISKCTNKEEKSKIFSNLFYMQIFSTIFISIVYLIYLFIFVRNNFLISLVMFFWILFSFLDIDWFWFGEQEFKRISIRNILIKSLTLVFIFAFVKKREDVYIYTIIMVMGFIVTYLANWIGIRNYVKFSKIDFAFLKSNFLPCLTMLIPVLALNIYRSMDKVILGSISGMNDTGIYENGEKIIYCLSSFISSLGTVMLPKISYLVEKKEKHLINQCINNSLKIVVALSSSMCFGVMAVSYHIIPIIFGTDFIESYKVLFLCAPTLLFMGWSNVIRTQYIIPYKKDQIYIKSIGIGCIINLFMDFILIPKLSYVGAVIGTICAEAFVPFYQFLKLRKELPYKNYIKNTFVYFFLGVIMLIILVAFDIFTPDNIYLLIIEIILGIFIYLLLFYFYIKYKDKELYNLIFNIKEKERKI